MLSVILPAKNEFENIQILIRSLEENLKSIEHELIVVDSHSTDGTADIARKMSETIPGLSVHVCPVGSGLALETFWGMSLAKYDLIAVMDTDLQHDPKYLPYLLEKMQDPTIDMVIGSRYVKGGDTGDWPWYRVIVSRIAVTVTKFLAGVRDPLTQYYIIRKSIVKDLDIQPTGMRLALYLLTKAPLHKVVEVPISFRRRIHGDTTQTFRRVATDLRLVLTILFARIGRMIKHTFHLPQKSIH